MKLKHWLYACVAIFLCEFVPAGGLLADTGANAFRDALQDAAAATDYPVYMRVNCTNESGIRSFEMFPDGVAIWNQRSQILLPQKARTSLIKTLLEQDFPAFDSIYGGGPVPVKTSAPVRISCRVYIDAGGSSKESVHQVGAETHSRLVLLANDLLDQVNKYSQNAVTPRDLNDALEKLSNGTLALQTLGLRFVDLPAQPREHPGTVLRIQGGRLSRQAYAPGQAGAEPVFEAFDHQQFEKLVEILGQIRFDELPGNMWYENYVEIELEVLAHRKVILARNFTRLKPNESQSIESGPTQLRHEQQRLDHLLTVLRNLGATGELTKNH